MHIDTVGVILIVFTIGAAGLLITVRLSKANRVVSQLISEPRLRRGDRPEVVLDVDGVRYDVTATGQMSEVRALVLWTYTAPRCAREANQTLVYVKEFPPETAVEVHME